MLWQRASTPGSVLYRNTISLRYWYPAAPLMLFYVLILATLNLGVGFAVAESLGRGPRLPSLRSVREWIQYIAWFVFDRAVHFRLPTRTASGIRTASSPTPVKPRSKPAPKPSSGRGEKVSRQAPEPRDADQVDVDTTPAESEPSVEQATATLDEKETPCDTSVEEASVEDMMAGLMQFREKVASLDTKVRKCVRQPETREVQQCVDEFKQANGEYLAHSDAITEKLSRPEAEGDSDALRAKMHKAVEQQANEVRLASQTLEHIDVERDPEAGCQAMLAQSGGLIASSSTLHNELTETRLELACLKGESIECDEMLSDPLTGLPNRIALERHLRQARPADDSDTAIAVALVDVDRLGELNSSLGVQAGDRLLCGIARILKEFSDDGPLLTRFEGQRFAIAFSGQPASDVCSHVEELRQQVEAVHFRDGDDTVAITASCAVADWAKNEELTNLFTRLEAALHEAKRFGRNRTFTHNGHSPAPVVPPEVTVETRTFDLNDL
ncbi:MAG: GGDEF domain-containing protein [Planctomycetales bacterium]|nr:GGDEF domain-containing protein [Planctomycetales bacterium]